MLPDGAGGKPWTMTHQRCDTASGKARRRGHGWHPHRQPGELPLHPRHLTAAVVAAHQMIAESPLLARLQAPGDVGGAVLDVPVVRGHSTQSLIGARAVRSLSNASR